MKTYQVSHFPVSKYSVNSSEFEEAFYNSQLRYSLRNLIFAGNISYEDIMELLQRSLQICHLAGVNSRHHFKQIYVFDEKARALRPDWLMSKNGLNLMVMQIPVLNEKIACWLWKLADL